MATLCADLQENPVKIQKDLAIASQECRSLDPGQKVGLVLAGVGAAQQHRGSRRHDRAAERRLRNAVVTPRGRADPGVVASRNEVGPELDRGVFEEGAELDEAVA